MKPGLSLFIAALAALVLSAAAFFYPALLFVWKIFCFVLLPVILVDALVLGILTDKLTVRRKISSNLALGRSTHVVLSVTRTGKGIIPASFSIFDQYDDSMNVESLPIRVKNFDLGNKNQLVEGVFEYEALPLERGYWEFPACELLLDSILRFWRLKVVHAVQSKGCTYPDFSKIASAKELSGLLQTSGMKNLRRRGQGLEFMGLRDFQTGDSIRAIDWRATSRKQKPIVREYQDDQDQNMLILLDSGYRLHRRDVLNSANEAVGTAAKTPVEALLFDSALNAALLLTHTALKHGDSVSAAVFGNEERWLPPRKGISALFQLMNGLFDVKSAGVPSSPFAALETAAERLTRRTFIVLISNFQKKDEEQLSWILPRISRHHLLLLVSLREMETEQIAAQLHGIAHPNADAILETAAAQVYLLQRRELFKKWEHSGLLTLETAAVNLSSALINRYLSVKRAGLL